MKQSYFGGTIPKTIDYRNARYQGLLDSNGKRHGFGMLLDDDMNVFSSEWAQGLVDGMTFMWFSNGNYFYGQWKRGQPHGLNVFITQQFTVYANYLQGNPSQEALIIDHKNSCLLVINGEDLINIDGRQLNPLSSEKIISTDYFEETLMYTAQQQEMNLENQLNLQSYLVRFASRYTSIRFNIIDNVCYFGYQEGLGLNFSFTDKNKQNLKIISIGQHSKGRLVQLGMKYHESFCAEEGNFNTKETISYNKHYQRPKEKCDIIYQNIHKKSLNFVNQYWEFKNHLILQIQTFLKNQISQQQHKQKEMNRTKFQDKKVRELTEDRQQFYRKAREDYKKAAGQIKSNIKYNHSKSSQSIFNNQKRRNGQSTQKVALIKHQRNHKDLYNQPFQRIEQNEEDYHLKKVNKNGRLKVYQKTSCQKCREKEIRRTNSKSNPKISIKVSPNKNKEKVNDKLLKDMKYLKNYSKKQIKNSPEHHKRKNTEPIATSPQGIRFRQRSRSKLDEEKNKEDIQYQNELKIRQQLYQLEQERDIKKEVKLQREILQLREKREFLNFQRERKEIQTKQLSYYPQRKVQQHQICLPISNSYQNLEDRRAKLLQDFRNMNNNLSHRMVGGSSYNFEIDSERKINPFQNSLGTEFVSSRRQIQQIDKENRMKIEEFNKKYRNLLSEGENFEERVEGEEKISKKRYVPEISSFEYHESGKEVFNLSSKKQRYEYYFGDETFNGKQ